VGGEPSRGRGLIWQVYRLIKEAVPRMTADSEFAAGIDSLAVGQLFRRRWVKGDALDPSRKPPP